MKKVVNVLLNHVLPIMLGVYLGFAATDYGEKREINRQKKIYSKILDAEILENKNEIENTLPYHKVLINDFAEMLGQESVVEAFNKYQIRGLRPGLLNRSAFETGIQSGILQELEIDRIQMLNRLYTLQDKYVRYTENFISSMMTQDIPTDEEEIRKFLRKIRMNLNDMVSFEEQLQAFYLEME